MQKPTYFSGHQSIWTESERGGLFRLSASANP
jgi:hypothetical protein